MTFKKHKFNLEEIIETFQTENNDRHRIPLYHLRFGIFEFALYL